MAKNVNHPKHYNSHEAGVECISVIRHYTCDIANALKYLWRAGLKPEQGKLDGDKEIEDLKKALWYINDYRTSGIHHIADAKDEVMRSYIERTTGYSIETITKGYDEEVADAMRMLLHIGLIVNGAVYHVYGWEQILNEAEMIIRTHILNVHMKMIKQKSETTRQLLNGEGVEGVSYVKKPGCERFTEPDNYDPLNCIISLGTCYSLCSEIKKKPNGAIYSPCELCAFSDVCDQILDDTTPCMLLCGKEEQYLREVGEVRYDPHSGTIEVYDPQKDHIREMAELDDEIYDEEE